MPSGALSRPSRAIFWAWLRLIIGNFGEELDVGRGILRRFFVMPDGIKRLRKEGRGVR